MKLALALALFASIGSVFLVFVGVLQGKKETKRAGLLGFAGACVVTILALLPEWL